MDSEREDERARSERIREINDRLRREMPHASLMLTRAVAALHPIRIMGIVQAVQNFNDFNRNNDPWGEHEFGAVKVGGAEYFWKIDAYDLNLEFGSPDPTDDAVTRRIITIMLPEDW